ncbi:hypothetical protein Q4543_21415 [Salipiger sp. 1_MG-2023]|nr:hypothetical protein [Salipiger sp. 1_MG-2023]
MPFETCAKALRTQGTRRRCHLASMTRATWRNDHRDRSLTTGFTPPRLRAFSARRNSVQTVSAAGDLSPWRMISLRLSVLEARAIVAATETRHPPGR